MNKLFVMLLATPYLFGSEMSSFRVKSAYAQCMDQVEMVSKAMKDKDPIGVLEAVNLVGDNVNGALSIHDRGQLTDALCKAIYSEVLSDELLVLRLVETSDRFPYSREIQRRRATLKLEALHKYHTMEDEKMGLYGFAGCCACSGAGACSACICPTATPVLLGAAALSLITAGCLKVAGFNTYVKCNPCGRKDATAFLKADARFVKGSLDILEKSHRTLRLSKDQDKCYLIMEEADGAFLSTAHEGVLEFSKP